MNNRPILYLQNLSTGKLVIFNRAYQSQTSLTLFPPHPPPHSQDRVKCSQLQKKACNNRLRIFSLHLNVTNLEFLSNMITLTQKSILLTNEQKCIPLHALQITVGVGGEEDDGTTFSLSTGLPGGARIF